MDWTGKLVDKWLLWITQLSLLNMPFSFPIARTKNGVHSYIDHNLKRKTRESTFPGWPEVTGAVCYTLSCKCILLLIKHFSGLKVCILAHYSRIWEAGPESPIMKKMHALPNIVLFMKRRGSRCASEIVVHKEYADWLGHFCKHLVTACSSTTDHSFHELEHLLVIPSIRGSLGQPLVWRLKRKVY